MVEASSHRQNMNRIHAFAYQLALGAVNGKWGIEVAYGTSDDDPWTKGWEVVEASVKWHDKVREFIQHTWLPEWKEEPSIQLLDIFDYITRTSAGNFRITNKAFALLDSPPVSIFISYRRSVSSALAMFIWAELRVEKFNPFLDIRNIAAGEAWRDLLERRVKESNIFIVVIGPGTLDSSYVQQEIQWALTNTKTRIIPVLHGGFTPADLEATPYAHLRDKNLVVIEKETSADMYNSMGKLKDTLWLYVGGQL